MKKEDVEKLAIDVTVALADSGQMVQGGWLMVYKLWLEELNLPPAQIHVLRTVFFAGAQHIFRSLMIMMTADAEPTEADLKRMDAIDAEIQEFERYLKRGEDAARQRDSKH